MMHIIKIQKILLLVISIIFLVSCSPKEPVETPNETIDPLMEIPSNLTYAYHTLSWDAVDSADFYRVKIGDALFDTTDTFFIVKSLPNNTYQASVSSQINNSGSLYSEPIEIEVNINQESPSVITSSSVIYTEQDITFVFSLLGGQFGSLSGNNITSNDYTFLVDTLTIKSSFIEAILQENPTRSTVIVAYQIQLNDNTHIGYLFININQ